MQVENIFWDEKTLKKIGFDNHLWVVYGKFYLHKNAEIGDVWIILFLFQGNPISGDLTVTLDSATRSSDDTAIASNKVSNTISTPFFLWTRLRFTSRRAVLFEGLINL